MLRETKGALARRRRRTISDSSCRLIDGEVIDAVLQIVFDAPKKPVIDEHSVCCQSSASKIASRVKCPAYTRLDVYQSKTRLSIGLSHRLENIVHCKVTVRELQVIEETKPQNLHPNKVNRGFQLLQLNLQCWR